MGLRETGHGLRAVARGPARCQPGGQIEARRGLGFGGRHIRHLALQPAQNRVDEPRLPLESRTAACQIDGIGQGRMGGCREKQELGRTKHEDRAQRSLLRRQRSLVEQRRDQCLGLAEAAERRRGKTPDEGAVTRREPSARLIEARVERALPFDDIENEAERGLAQLKTGGRGLFLRTRQRAPAMAFSRAMRSSVLGCVEKRLPKLPPCSGLTMKRWAVAGLRSASGFGRTSAAP